MEKRDEKNIYTYFRCDKDLMDCVCPIAPISVKNIFEKKWGIYLNKYTYATFSDEESKLFEKSVSWCERKLEIARQLRNKGFTLKEIKTYLQSGSIQNVREKNLFHIYENLSEFLEYYSLTKEELFSILKEVPKESATYFIKMYLKNKTIEKSCIDTIADEQKVSRDSIISGIKRVYDDAEKYRLKKKLQKEREPQNHVQKRVYVTIEELLEANQITLEELDIIIDELPRKEKISFIYVHGFNGRSKLRISKIAQVLGVSETDVRCYLASVYQKIEKYAVEGKKYTGSEMNIQERFVQATTNEKSQPYIRNGKVITTSMYSGYDQKDWEYITKEIEAQKETLYNIIVHAYGEKYDTFDKEAYLQLSNTERSKLSLFKFKLKQKVDIYRDKEETYILGNGACIRKNVYAYFEGEMNGNIVIQTIEIWDREHNYLLSRLYGEFYNKWNLHICRNLSNSEEQLLSNLESDFRNSVRSLQGEQLSDRTSELEPNNLMTEIDVYITHSGKKIKKSMYNGYEEDEWKYVTEIIEKWSDTNTPYYEMILRLYGPHYDNLNIEECKVLRGNEKAMLDRIFVALEKQVENFKAAEASGIYVIIGRRKVRKTMYSGYEEDEWKYVTEIIEKWSDTNTPYYEMILRLYGPHYDNLNIEECKVLTRNEKVMLDRIFVGLERQVASKKAQSELVLAEEKTDAMDCSENTIHENASCPSTNRDLSDEMLCNLLHISIEQLDMYYCECLHLLGANKLEVIERMIKRSSENVEKILTQSYLKNYLQYLTREEQLYLQLKLLSYSNTKLTDTQIAQFLRLSQSDIVDYQIMSNHSELNEMNQLLKK